MLADTKWRAAGQADGILTDYKKFLYEVKQLHHDNFAKFNFLEER